MKQSEGYLYQEIAEALRRRIASGELKAGDKLPPVREMAQQWNCTPGTVSRAYGQLAQEGLVEGHRGAGTRITADSLPTESTSWQWASLVNRAEQFLLEAIGRGNSPAQAEAALSVAISRWREWQDRQTPPPSAQEPPDPRLALNFAGSHDLTIELLPRLLAEEMPEARLSLEYLGSLGGLMALARQQAQVAGSHLWDEATDTYNEPFIRRLLPGRRVALLTLVHRSLGLIVPAGNPQQLRTLSDLGRPEVKLVNRQRGSGTRVWLDARLKSLPLQPEALPGYEVEKLTHLAVAEAVQQGEATVGLGLHAAASAYGLDFIPLTQEPYELVFPESVWQIPVAQALVKVVRSDRFKEAVTALGGYDTAPTGQERWLS